MTTLRTSISIPTELHRKAVARAHSQHRDFSGHVCNLLALDLALPAPDYLAMQAAADAILAERLKTVAATRPPAKRRRAAKS